MRRGRLFAAFGFLILIAAAVGAYFLFRGPSKAPAAGPAAFEPAEAVEIVAARETTWQPTADLVGTVFALREVTVRNELPGVVVEVGFQSGDIVEEGQVLLRQDDTTELADLAAVQASVRVAQANVAQSESEISLAQAELDRLTSIETKAVAQVEIDRARTKLETATADRGKWLAEVDQARARVAQVEARLAKLTIKAPFRARAGMRTVHEGQYLAEGVAVVALQETSDKIYLDFAIPQEYSARVTPGTVVMANADILGPDPFRVEVVAVDATVSMTTRNLRVRAIVDNSRGILVPGMFVQVRVPIDEPKPFIVVPSTAVRRAAYANSVFVITPDDSGAERAHQRFVTLGHTIGNDVIVLDGIAAGERVAAAGSFKLHDGVKILPGAPDTPPAATAAAN